MRIAGKVFTRYFRAAGREFPWRVPGTSPFHVLLAELLLRQTDAPKVSGVWTELVNLAPDAETFLTLDSVDVLRIIEPLGLGRQRIHALQTCCGAIVTDHHGNIPRSPYKLLSLPHVGLYSAAAVACFAFNQRLPVVDGNVLRVLGRVVDQDLGLDNRRSAFVWQLAWMILPSRNYRIHNFGILDFSAQICTARAPKHTMCALNSRCRCYQAGNC